MLVVEEIFAAFLYFKSYRTSLNRMLT